ncbi:Rab11 family-interacting protein 3 [Lemmus lemmus]
MEAIQKQEEINFRLQDYIDRILVAILETNPSILEVNLLGREVENEPSPQLLSLTHVDMVPPRLGHSHMLCKLRIHKLDIDVVVLERQAKMTPIGSGPEPQATYFPCAAQAFSYQMDFHSPLDPGPPSHTAILWLDPYYSHLSALVLVGLGQLVHADCGTYFLDW